MPTTEPDALSIFPPEGGAEARGRALTTEISQATPRSIPATRETRKAPEKEVKSLDDFRRLLGQTQIVLERSKGDANALRGDLNELRSFGAHLGQGYTRLGEICRLTEKRSELAVDALSAIEKRIEPLEVVRDLSATTADKLAALNRLVEEVSQCLASYEAQKQAIDHGREEATRVVRLMEGLQARVTSLTEKGEWLGRVETTVGRLEHRANETTAWLERRVNDFDSQKRTIERTVVEAMRVGAILNRLEGRVAALAGSDHALGQAETAIDQLERRANEARVRLDEVIRTKVDVEHDLANVEKQLQTLTESTRNLLNAPGSTEASKSRAGSVGRPLLRWATIAGALVAVALLGVVVLRTRDRSSQIARTAPTTQWRASGATPISQLPTEATRLAMVDMPAGRAAATKGKMAAQAASSGDRPDLASAMRTAPTTGVSRAVGAAKETVQYVGILAVESEPPGSVVFVDRQQVGRTPLQLRRLRAGSHVVRIERDGYDRWTTAVLVPADKQTRVSAKLQAARDR